MTRHFAAEKPSMANKISEIERKLVSILSADVAEYSRLMSENEEETTRVFREHRVVFEQLVNLHRGRIFNTAGDAILAEFNSAVEAVRCATEIQSALRTRNDKLPESRQVNFRIGVNLGDVIVQGTDLLGDGVNIAARLQSSAEPGGVCISGSIYDQVKGKLSLSMENLGDKSFKNIPHTVRTFSIRETENRIPLPYAKLESGSTVKREAKARVKGESEKFPAFFFAAGVAAIVLCTAVGSYFALRQEKGVDVSREVASAPAALEAAVSPAPAPALVPVPEGAKAPDKIDRNFVKGERSPARWVISTGIAQAVAKADPGDVIELMPGIYKEHIKIEKDVLLRGQADADGKVAVRIEWNGAETIEVISGKVRLENISVVLTPDGSAKTPAAILVVGGSLELHNVFAFGAGKGTAAFSQRDGGVTATKSEFGGFRGIEQYGGKFSCEDCVASGNREEGAVFMNQSGSAEFKTTLKNFKAERNGLNGLAVMAKTTVTIDGCAIRENGVNGVLVNADGVGIFENCHVSENKENGLVATDDARAEFLGSFANKNVYSGLAATLRAKLKIRKSELTGNGEFGFALLDQASADEDKNKIAGNRGGMSYRAPASVGKP